MYNLYLKNYYLGLHMLDVVGGNDDLDVLINRNILTNPYSILGQMEAEILFPCNTSFRKFFIISRILMEKLYGQRPIYLVDTVSFQSSNKPVKIGWRISLTNLNFINFLEAINNSSSYKSIYHRYAYFMSAKNNVKAIDKVSDTSIVNMNKDVRRYDSLFDDIEFKISFRYPHAENEHFNQYMLQTYGLDNIYNYDK